MPEGDTIYRTARALEKALGGKVVTAFDTGFAKLASANDDSPVVGRTVEKVEARGKWCLIFFSGDLILVSHMLMSGSWHVYRAGEKWWMPRSKMRVAITVGDRAHQGLKPGCFLGDGKGTPEVVPLRGAGRDFTDYGESENAVDGGVAIESHADSDSTLRNEREGWATRTVGGATQSGRGFQAVLFNAQIAEFHTARSLERSSQVPKLGPDVLAGEFSVEQGVAALRERKRTHPQDEIAVVLLNQRVMAGLGNVYKSEVAFAAG